MNDKYTILERLSKREEQRIDKLQKDHKAKVDVQSTDEQEEYFVGVFQEKSAGIQELLSRVPTIYSDMLLDHFIMVKKEMNELQKYVVSSSLFLKEFNMRKYLGMVQDLQTQCYELEEQYMPRKKFGFSRKKTTKAQAPKAEKVVDVTDGNHESISIPFDEDFYGFHSRQNENLHLSNGELYQRDVTLRNLTNCTIILRGNMGTLHISSLSNCIILCGPVNTSVFMDKCVNCKIVVICQQLRMHSSKHIEVYLHVTSKGIIEDCTCIRTAPYNLEYEGLDIHLAKSSLDLKSNNWDNIADFNWLSPDFPSPNWTIMDKLIRISDWAPFLTQLPSDTL